MTEDIARLVERLRGGENAIHSHHPSPLDDEAADAIERLSAELLLTQAERTRAQQACEQMGARIAELEKALGASIAANELVLAQLRGGSDLSAEQVAKTLNAALDSARAALESK